MPSIAQITGSLIPAGATAAQWLASRKSLNNATGTINAGAQKAGAGLATATNTAIQGQKDALAAQKDIATGSVARTDAATQAGLDAQGKALNTQKGVYDKTVGDNQPYQDFGKQSIKQLQDLQANPGSITSNPGYQFEMDQGLKGGQRAAAASGTLGNGGTIKSQTRYALDFATTKYQQALDNLNRSVGIGERANAADASAGVTFGNQSQTNADQVGNINRTGANADNATMNTLGEQTGTAATNEGVLGTRGAEDQAALTLAQSEAAAKNQVLQGNNTNTALGTAASLAPTIAKAFGIGAPAAAAGAAGAGAAAGTTATVGSLAGITGAGGALAPGAIAAPALASGAATGVTGALGLGGGAGLLGLGAATIPVVGGIIAGGALLANHFIGQGRKAADKLTGSGGIQHAFEQTLSTIDAQPGYTEAQKWQSKVQAYDKLEQLALEFAKKGSNEKKVASQMFDTIAPLFGKSNPLKAAA